VASTPSVAGADRRAADASVAVAGRGDGRVWTVQGRRDAPGGAAAGADVASGVERPCGEHLVKPMAGKDGRPDPRIVRDARRVGAPVKGGKRGDMGRGPEGLERWSDRWVPENRGKRGRKALAESGIRAVGCSGGDCGRGIENATKGRVHPGGSVQHCSIHRAGSRARWSAVARHDS
jgi:hypothetical protein